MAPRGAISGINMRSAATITPSTIGQTEQDNPAGGEHFQRRIAEGKDASLRPLQVLQKVVCALAEHPLRPDIIHPGLAEADVSSQSSEKQISLRGPQQPTHNSSIDQGKIAGVERDLDIAQIRKEPIEGFVQNTPTKRHVPLDASPINDIVAVDPLMIKLLDQFGRILQITVEKDASLHDRHFHPASEGHLRAKIARMRDPEDMRVCAPKSPECGRRNRRGCRHSRK